MSIRKVLALQCSDGESFTNEEDALEHEVKLLLRGFNGNKGLLDSSWPPEDDSAIIAFMCAFPHEIEAFFRNLYQE